jgi:hypothetical protein
LAHSTIIIIDVAAGSGGFGEVVRWWGGFARWYWTYHPTRYHKKIIEFVFGGGESYSTIKMEGFPLPMRFLFFEYSNIFDFPARVRFGGEMPTDNIMLLINNQS